MLFDKYINLYHTTSILVPRLKLLLVYSVPTFENVSPKIECTTELKLIVLFNVELYFFPISLLSLILVPIQFLHSLYQVMPFLLIF